MNGTTLINVHAGIGLPLIPRLCIAIRFLLTVGTLILLGSSRATSQVCFSPTDDLMLPSNSTLTHYPGTYEVKDTLTDGVLRIENVRDVTIEGAGVTLKGPGATGYAIVVKNSSRVTITG